MIIEVKEKETLESLFLLSGAYRKSDYSMIVIISINKRSILKNFQKSRGSKYTSFFEIKESELESTLF